MDHGGRGARQPTQRRAARRVRARAGAHVRAERRRQRALRAEALPLVPAVGVRRRPDVQRQVSRAAGLIELVEFVSERGRRHHCALQGRAGRVQSQRRDGRWRRAAAQVQGAARLAAQEEEAQHDPKRRPDQLPDGQAGAASSSSSREPRAEEPGGGLGRRVGAGEH